MGALVPLPRARVCGAVHGRRRRSRFRILVHTSIFDEFGKRLAAKADGLRLGPPLDGATQIGPLASVAALAKVDYSLEK